MKNYLTIFLMFGVLQLVNAINPKSISVKDNYVEFSPNLYVSKYETTNLDYNEFLQDIKANSSRTEYVKCKPDSSLWLKLFSYSYNEPFTKLYHTHASYNMYPAVSISKEAIEKYCAWLTEKYNENPKREFKKVIFRLPSEQEWMKFSTPLPDQRLPWFGNSAYVVDSKDKIVPLANVKMMDYATGKYNLVDDKGFINIAVGAYKSNKLGLFDIIGNAAELTSEGKVKGGSWDNIIEECFIDKTQNISLPDPRVGFRLVMDVTEK